MCRALRIECRCGKNCQYSRSVEQSRACRHRRACEEFRHGDIDTDFAKEQLDLMLESFYLHPTGQIPAYEWNFSDVNPPVHAWGSIFLYRTEQALYGGSDIDFLKRSFAKSSFLIAINPSDLPLQARIRVPWAELAGTTWKLTDMLAEVTYEREGNEMLSSGLYLELRPWGYHFFWLEQAGNDRNSKTAGHDRLTAPGT